MTLHRQHLGIAGENLAVAALEARGYAILERRYRCERGEIDIVARDGDTLVFVEVKARETREFGSAAEALTVRKQRQVVAIARDYLARHHAVDAPCRFDVVAIDDAAEEEPVVMVYRAAFDATRR